ncbi:hypothetical protein BC938DRAFT_482456 [Jimgerdemannia flammicorona]|uniref:Uncharacterized protein n=1 Tax=Jimgerdemannia flammicorona TaxID=994334 RepID=A0A433QE32_9FUNG|nr:hypothetical protein BC938DRAFT_482456 [Jimgerdemannia flammicorona]
MLGTLVRCGRCSGGNTWCLRCGIIVCGADEGNAELEVLIPFSVTHLEEVGEHGLPVLTEDAFRMELDALDGELPVADGHDDVVFRPSVITGDVDILWDAAEEALSIVLDGGGLAVKDLARVADCAAKDLEDALLTEADAQNRDLAGEVRDNFARDTGVRGRVARSRGDDNVARVPRLDVLDGGLVVAIDLHLGAEGRQVLVDVPGETVVVVDEDCSHFRCFVDGRCVQT